MPEPPTAEPVVLAETPVKIVLIPHWKKELTRLWSMKVAYFWLAVGAITVLWPGLAGSISAGIYLTVGFLLIFSFGAARMLKQPGTEP